MQLQLLGMCLLMSEETADRLTQLPPRVKFGPRDNQEMPFLWAEKGLCWLFENRKQAFADMMLAVMDTGFSTSRAPKNGSNGHR